MLKFEGYARGIYIQRKLRDDLEIFRWDSRQDQYETGRNMDMCFDARTNMKRE